MVCVVLLSVYHNIYNTIYFFTQQLVFQTQKLLVTYLQLYIHLVHIVVIIF